MPNRVVLQGCNLLRWIIVVLVLCSVVTLGYFFKGSDTAQQAWDEWTSEPKPVWSYGQGNYSLLGFNPAIDAFLGDPFFIPRFAADVSLHIGSELTQALDAAWRFSAYGNGVVTECKEITPPEDWQEQLGKAAMPAYSAWKCFLAIRKDVIQIFSGLNKSDREFIQKNYSHFFFDPQEPDIYDILTTDSLNPFLFYVLSRKIDLQALAFQERRLASMAKYLAKSKPDFKFLPLYLNFTREEEGAKLLISGIGNDIHKEDVDFLIDAGGDDIYLNNAGGTAGKFPVSFLIDFSGNDAYSAKVASQGAGLLGLGFLADLEGDDSYKATELSQGAAFFGSGVLWDDAGNDKYSVDWFGQGAAVFGTAMLFDKSGRDTYEASSFAQAASSTSGAAWLVDLSGDDHYGLGHPDKTKFNKNMGIGQGASIGVRFFPFEGTPSLYGGLSFLYDTQGDDVYKGNWFSQGSGYFLGAGILMDAAGNDKYQAQVNSQGQGLHLAAGLLLDKAGNDIYQAQWGSQGVGGDLSVGVLIDEKGNDSYYVQEQGIGTARKPHALGLFFDGCCDNKYVFKTGNTDVVPPETPEEWPSALFIDAGGGDGPSNAPKKSWGVKGHSLGVHGEGELKGNWLDYLPLHPRVAGMTYDSDKGWPETGAISAINTSQLPDLKADTLISARNKLEIFDLIRFSQESTDKLVESIPAHLLKVLESPTHYYNPVIIYALQWFINTQNNMADLLVSNALIHQTFSEPLMRRYALLYLAYADPIKVVTVAERLFESDPSLSVRTMAIFILALAAEKDTLPIVQKALKSDQELIRYGALQGISISKPPGWQEWVRPLLSDPSPYVSQEAKNLLQGKQN